MPARDQNNEANSSATALFGFREVPETDKPSLVSGVFDRVAPRYDLMNDLMSIGVHRLWKRALIDWLKPRPGMQLIDIGGGTGDISFQFIAAGGTDAVICDPNWEMLSEGRDRAINRGLLQVPRWICGTAEQLPFPDNAADACVTAFSLRNVTRLATSLSEIRRVLRPGGRFLCLEFSHVSLPLLSSAYDAYSFRLLPVLGQLIAGDREAYQYLVESIRRFPDQETLAEAIGAAGLSQVKYRNLSGGIVALHSAWRL